MKLNEITASTMSELSRINSNQIRDILKDILTASEGGYKHMFHINN